MSVNLTNYNYFDICMNYGTFINKNFLNDLYLPIIGYLPIQIYNILISEYESKINSSIFTNTYNKLINKLKINQEELLHSFKLLESVSLISTYLDNSDLSTPKIIHFINEPLNFFNFIQNDNLNRLLKNKISDDEYTELKYKYNNNIIKSSYINVSKDISYLIDELNLDEFELDFNALYTYVSQKINNHFLFDEISKQKINYYYKKHNFTISQLGDCIYNSLMIEDNKYIISYNVLISKLENMLSNSIPKNINIITKINRKYDFFLNNVDSETYKMIYDDYVNNNSENYIISITKDEIGYEMSNLLKLLREKFFLSDEIINCIIDYSLFHNYGRLVPNYIKKIAKSINNLSFDSLKSVISYLRDVNINKKPYQSLTSNQYSNSSNFNVNDENLDDIWKEL